MRTNDWDDLGRWELGPECTLAERVESEARVIRSRGSDEALLMAVCLDELAARIRSVDASTVESFLDRWESMSSQRVN
jgi:hypothetical protein